MSSSEAAAPVAWMPGAFDGASAAPRAVAWDDFAPAFAGAGDEAFGLGFAEPPADGAAADAGFAGALPDFVVDSARERAFGAHPGTGALIATLEARAAEREQALRAELAAALEARAAEDAARHEAALAAAWAEGHAAGHAEGEQAAHEALAAVGAALEEAHAQLLAHEARWLGNLQENVAALAVGVARHVIEREVAADAALVRGLAERAVAEYPLDEALTLRVHPGDLPALRAAMSAVPGTAGARELRWIADAQIARGGCVVEGRERIVDGRVDAALERVYRALSGQHA